MDVILFVDGYNIINAWPELKEINEISLEAARDELIYLMAEYKVYTGTDVIIVFDALNVKGKPNREENIKGVKIVYSKHGETADHYIEKSVKNYIKNHLVKVATSDWVEQQVIMAQGAVRVSASELRDEIKRVKKSISGKIKKDDSANILWDNISPEVLEKLKKIRGKN